MARQTISEYTRRALFAVTGCPEPGGEFREHPFVEIRNESAFNHESAWRCNSPFVRPWLTGRHRRWRNSPDVRNRPCCSAGLPDAGRTAREMFRRVAWGRHASVGGRVVNNADGATRRACPGNLAGTSPQLLAWLNSSPQTNGFKVTLDRRVHFEFGWSEKVRLLDAAVHLLVRHDDEFRSRYLKQRRRFSLVEHDDGASDIHRDGMLLLSALQKGIQTNDIMYARLPPPVRYRVTGAQEAWRSFRRRVDASSSTSPFEVLDYSPITTLVKIFGNMVKDVFPQERQSILRTLSRFRHLTAPSGRRSRFAMACSMSLVRRCISSSTRAILPTMSVSAISSCQLTPCASFRAQSLGPAWRMRVHRDVQVTLLHQLRHLDTP